MAIRYRLWAGSSGSRSGSLDHITEERSRFIADLKRRAASDEESRNLLRAFERKRVPDGARVLYFKSALEPGLHTVTVEARLKGDERLVLASEPYVINISGQ